MKYQTMTPAGGTGAGYEAYSDEEAETLATADGYEVLDVQEAAYPAATGYDYILVIAD